MDGLQRPLHRALVMALVIAWGAVYLIVGVLVAWIDWRTEATANTTPALLLVTVAVWPLLALFALLNFLGRPIEPPRLREGRLASEAERRRQQALQEYDRLMKREEEEDGHRRTRSHRHRPD